MKILLAEDEAQMSQAETAFLQLKGFTVDVAANGAQALELSRRETYDVIVLDIMMPVMDGMEALREMRKHGNTTPVIMLTAKAEVEDRVQGLSDGADDYLTKPFSLFELEARIRAQIRRSEHFAASSLSYRGLKLDVGEQELSCRSAIRLSGKECRLMEFLIRNAEKSLGEDEICRHVWDEMESEAEDSAERVYLYISYLREKMKSIFADVEIRDEAGHCYRLCGVDR